MATKLKQRAQTTLELLREEYGPLQCPLFHDNEWQLLIAVILSAQCTDEMVNKVTPDLFAQFPSIDALADAHSDDIAQAIKRIGLYKSKAKNIQLCCARLRDVYDYQVPDTMEDLTSLAGVGRKTANVILGEVFGKPGLVVDTHVKRISNLLGWTKEQDPVKIEYALQKLFAPEDWRSVSLGLIFHGRAVCVARRPQCGGCLVAAHCPAAKPAKS